VYDYLGRRVEKKVSTHNGTSWSVDDRRRFVWSDWLPVLELDASDPNDVTILRKYTWGLDLSGQSGGSASGRSIDDAGGIGGLLATEDVADTKDYYYLYDANGNVGQVLDGSDGSIAAKYEYDAYGNNLLDPNDPNQSGPYAADNPFRFSTKYWDDETELGYWGYRYYSPRLGRWINRDPAAEAGGLNLFAYVENEVTGYVDPLGTKGYTFDTGPLCGAFVVDVYKRSFDDTKHEKRFKDLGMDPAYVRSFDLTFLPKPTNEFKGFTPCCVECCDGGIRVIQAIYSKGSGRGFVIDDPAGKIKKKNKKDPKGCPPPGYVGEGGGIRGKRGKYSHCDSPNSRGGGAYIEACAMCTDEGRDTLLGCIEFTWKDGTEKKQWRDRGPSNLGTPFSIRNGVWTYFQPSQPMGKTFRKALEKWNEDAGSQSGD